MTRQSEASSNGHRGQSVEQALVDVGGLLFGYAKSMVGPPLAGLVRYMRWRAIGYGLALLAMIWAAIALTLAAAQHLPLWASFLCVSALLVVVAAGAFTFSTRENGSQESREQHHLE